MDIDDNPINDLFNRLSVSIKMDDIDRSKRIIDKIVDYDYLPF